MSQKLMVNKSIEKKFIVKTLGCKVNSADGQHLEVGLRTRGFESTLDLAEANLVIVNSCTVTNEADRQSQKMVRDIHKRYPDKKIIYTGCAAEVNPELALKIPGVSAVLGNQNKGEAASIIETFLKSSAAPVSTEEHALATSTAVKLGSVTNYEAFRSQHPMDRAWQVPESEISSILNLNDLNNLDGRSSTHRTRAFIKIQEGCNSFCTYCIIPYGRGPSRSVPIETVVKEIKKLVDHGMKEVILTGINLGEYGVDLSRSLQIDDLIEAILTQTNLPRLRVGSLDPSEISDRMLKLMEDHESFCPHFHVSLQHLSSKILRLMKRKYSSDQASNIFKKIAKMKRKPFVGIDWITGFPGEDEQNFEEGVSELKDLLWSRLHVFPYSERAGTPATRLPFSVEPSERKARAKALQELSLSRLVSVYASARSQFDEFTSRGTLKNVLLESKVRGPDGTRNWVFGYAPHYQRVLIPENPNLDFKNEIVDVNISRFMVDRASGDVTWLGEYS